MHLTCSGRRRSRFFGGGFPHTLCAGLVFARVAWIALAHGAMSGIALRFVAHVGWKGKEAII